jgi:hypothetical protein
VIVWSSLHNVISRALTVFACGSHYFQLQNSEIWWHCLLVWSMTVCILCTSCNCIKGISVLVFILEWTQQIICTGTLHCEEVVAFMPPVHVCQGRNSIWNEEVLNAIYTNPLIITCWATYQICLKQNAGWFTLHEDHLYSFHAQQQGLQLGYNNLPFQFCWWFLHRTLDEPNFHCALYCGVIRQHSTRSEVNNLHNLHECLLENPHASEHSSVCQRCSISI